MVILGHARRKCRYIIPHRIPADLNIILAALPIVAVVWILELPRDWAQLNEILLLIIPLLHVLILFEVFHGEEAVLGGEGCLLLGGEVSVLVQNSQNTID